ncbi:MAG: HAD-IIIA family hydrolase [Lachnospiraceae bacterium]|nr:HAD-IIIA family hydrolase [Lachnospiraceae bacterium]
MKTIIMAGGKGTRISALFPDVPKPLIPIEGKPVLEWEICSLRDQGFMDIILTVSHMADKIRAYFGDGSAIGVHIEYFVEEQPLGNAGALYKMRDRLTEPFLLLNADAVFDIDFNRLVAFHKSHGGLVTLFTHPNNHPYDSGVLTVDEMGAVQQWLTKEDVRPEFYKNRVNAGLHVIDPAALDMAAVSSDGQKMIDTDAIGTEVDGKRVKVDLDRQILKPLCGTGKMFCYDSPEYVKDMGTPERFEQVCRDFSSGLVQGKNLKHKQRAIFLDRDGTINKYVGFLRNIDDFELLPGVAEALRRINASGFLAIIVTNQPVIARGEVTVLQLQEIHDKMETLLGVEGAYLDGLYYCPHHPHKGYEGEVPELKIECECRKPKPGMILKAAGDFNIDLSESWMIGDGENDIRAGKAAGCRTALIGNGDFGQNMTVESLLEFVKKVGINESVACEGGTRNA